MGARGGALGASATSDTSRTAGRTATPSTCSTRRWWAPGRSTPGGPPPSWRRRPRKPRSTPPGPTRAPATTTPCASFVAADPRPTRASSPTWRPSWPSTGSSSWAGSARWPRPTLLLTCPGVPDLYQGTEVWDLSLVDPDNRRPVDYERAPPPAGQPGGHRARGGAGPRRRGRPEALADPPRCSRHRRRHPGGLRARLRLPAAAGGRARGRPRGGLHPHRRAGRGGAAAGGPPGPGWAAPRSSRCPAAPGSTCSPASRSTAVAASVAVAARRFPVAVLGREELMHEFRVVGAAPPARSRSVVGGQRLPMQAEPAAAGGRVRAAAAGPGTDYAFRLDGGPPRPDPRSAFQPRGIDGPSRVVDHSAFAWTDRAGGALPLRRVGPV